MVATNVAETSITIPHIRYVVDTGKVSPANSTTFSGGVRGVWGMDVHVNPNQRYASGLYYQEAQPQADSLISLIIQDHYSVSIQEYQISTGSTVLKVNCSIYR